jgi:ABC-type phosphate/phosphonate transport system permease subunit
MMDGMWALMIMAILAAFLAGGAFVFLLLLLAAKDFGPQTTGDQTSKGRAK